MSERGNLSQALGERRKHGNASTSQRQEFELYLPSSEDRYNRALTMLLETVNLFITQHVDRYKDLLDGKKVQLYHIEGDKINNSSIRYSSENLEQWTRACKCLLMQL